MGPPALHTGRARAGPMTPDSVDDGHIHDACPAGRPTTRSISRLSKQLCTQRSVSYRGRRTSRPARRDAQPTGSAAAATAATWTHRWRPLPSGSGSRCGSGRARRSVPRCCTSARLPSPARPSTWICVTAPGSAASVLPSSSSVPTTMSSAPPLMPADSRQYWMTLPASCRSGGCLRWRAYELCCTTRQFLPRRADEQRVLGP